MIIATIAALMLVFGGGSLEFYLTDLKGSVKEHVQDEDRRAIILDTSKALAKELKTLEKEVGEHFEDLIEVHSEYKATLADYDTAGAKIKADQQTLSALVLDARDAMHKQMTREEWEAVFQSSEK